MSPGCHRQSWGLITLVSECQELFRPLGHGHERRWPPGGEAGASEQSLLLAASNGISVPSGIRNTPVLCFDGSLRNSAEDTLLLITEN